jgi:hypothetical protein
LKILGEIIKKEEHLFRAVFPYDFLWDFEKDKPSSAVFKNRNGCSVNRQGDLSVEQSFELIKESFKKSRAIAYFTKETCDIINVYAFWKPSKNKYHSELWDSKDVVEINSYKCKLLSDIAQIHKIT